jgi:outer membrane protein insertion porin family
MVIKSRAPKLSILSCAFLALVFSYFSYAALAEDATYVSSVEIRGNKRIDTEAIKSQLKVTNGNVLVSDISKDITTLYATGFFDKVDALVSGSSTLVYSVTEKPMVRKVFITGNDDIGEGDLSELIKFGEKRFLDKAKVNGLQRSVITFYQAKGYNDAKISHEIKEVGDNQVDITFNVTEGRRYKLNKIKFKGLNQIDDSDLLDVMQTKTYRWYSSWLMGTGRASEDLLQADRGAIRQYFLDHGFVDGTISDPTIDYNPQDATVQVTFDVNEGKQYKIGTVAAAGDLVNGSVSETIDGVESETGEIFSASTIRKDSFLVSDKFGDIGYAFANVVPNTDVKPEEAVVNITFQVSKGKPVTINRINIKGNEKTYDNVIRREIRVQESQLYSSSKIKRSQALLERLGYFDEVTIANEPIPGRDDIVDLNVAVREAQSTGSFSIGAGYSSTDGGIINARLTENNVLGTGRRLDLNADFGSQRNNLILSLSDRRILDTDLAGSVEGFRSSRLFFDFEKVLTGGAVSVGYPLENWFGETFEDMNTNLRYEAANVEIKGVDDDAAQLILNSEGTSTNSALTPSITRNTINNPLNPTKGSLQMISFDYAGLGGDNEYTLLEARNTFFYPLFTTDFGEFTLSNRTRFGYGESNSDDPFPLFKRYFPGGINSVRGYDPRRLGPSENGSVFGGAKQFINNAEIIFPLINSAGIKGVVFYDAGQAFLDDESIDFGALRQSWGAGIRWMSPMGPLRFEFGIPIDRQPGEDSLQPMFTFGAPL